MTKHTTMPIEQLRDLLAYDPQTGLLTRRENGKRALYTLNYAGYFWGRVQSKLVLAHRAAWAISHGEWVSTLDHINRDKLDNRICNLRSVTAFENARNTAGKSEKKSRYIGVGYLPSANRWVARCCETYLGCFESELEAAKCYDRALRKLGKPDHFLNFPNET